MTKIIDRNTTIPARRTETFSTAEDNQSAVDVVVLQGERERASDNRVLGNFQLTDIPPAPRGQAEIDVTFDVDANGIVNVNARDKATGAERGITISESSNLDQQEVDRMIQEAERSRSEDAALRAAVDARNELDSVAYQVDRMLQQLGANVPEHERARAEMLVNDAREAVKNEAPPERARELTSELQQVMYALQSASAGQAGAGGQQGQGAGPSPDGGTASDDEDIVDAEFDRA
jgi:molecular chaperone DnaK